MSKRSLKRTAAVLASLRQVVGLISCVILYSAHTDLVIILFGLIFILLPRDAHKLIVQKRGLAIACRQSVRPSVRDVDG